MGVLVDEGFNCFIHYISSIEKCCFLFGDIFAKWYSTDADSLKHFAAYAHSACALAVASTENSSCAKWLKTLGTPYIPEKEQHLSQVPLVLRTHFGEYLYNLSNFSCMSVALQHGKNFLVTRA